MPGDKQRSIWKTDYNFGQQTTQGRDLDAGATGVVQAAALLSSLRLSQSRANGKRVTPCGEHSYITEDGLICTGQRDPPGQASVYIPPGDHRVESYRLSTFSRWSQEAPVSKNALAESGFYYTGFGDRVRCFSCGISVENWTVGDDGANTRWHKSDCAMAAGNDAFNVPSITLKRRLKSFAQSSWLQQYSLASSCGSQYRNSYQSTLDQDWRPGVPDAISTGVATGTSRIQQSSSLLRIGEIHSPEHREHVYSSNLTKEADRRKTYAKWPSYPAPELPGKLAEEGLFYLGNLDRTQCFSCGGILRNWARNDIPRTEHQRHFPNCRIIMGLELRNIPLTLSERRVLDNEDRHRMDALLNNPPVEPPDPPLDEQRFLEVQFPCKNPINPHMRDLAARIATFGSAWPAHKMRTTPKEIAKAGFFSLGNGDKTKCFYCNGGLQNWDSNDEPWTEHGKWFPGCEFVIRCKGTSFVRELFEANPNLSRPAVRNPVSYDVHYIPQAHISQLTTVIHGSPSPIAGVAAKQETNNARHALNELLSERLCKGCFQDVAEHLLQPCGHIVLCSRCATSLRTCPICKVKIESVMKVYRT